MKAQSEKMLAEVEWLEVRVCPSCGSDRRSFERRPTAANYLFGGRSIRIPGGMRIRRCSDCTLAYKTHVPSPVSLVALTELSQSELWRSAYSFAPELAALSELKAPGFSLLDVGSAGGHFLNAASVIAERRSGLDIVRFETLIVPDDGEFITGFLDNEVLSWSHRPYDVVTAFDIFEHLYHPNQALANLSNLVRADGIVMLETGNADVVARPERWYYLALFEHHVAWTPRALSMAVDKQGFDLVSVSTKFHKTARQDRNLLSELKYLTYSLNPSFYHRLQLLGGFDGSIPPKPGQRDHMRAILRRREY